MSEFKKETIEEVAKRLYYNIGEDTISSRESFIKGAKWQKEQINFELSELLEQNKEMLAMLERLILPYLDITDLIEAEQLIKKVKDNEK